MPEQLPLFEIRLRKRGRAYRWQLCTADGRAVMQGSEGSRVAARYQANRALFLMLLASVYHPFRVGYSDGSHSRRSPFIRRLSKFVQPAYPLRRFRSTP